MRGVHVKLARTVAAGTLFACMYGIAAGSPPLDRPTPPPCCADGHAWASPAVYGVFPTRWRRWPLESVEEAPAGKPAELPEKFRPYIPPYVPPEPKDEDRKAPAPTTPSGEQGPATTGPAPTQRGPGGAAPGSPVPPSAGPGTQQPLLPMYPQQGPVTTPQTSPLTTPQTTPLTPPSTQPNTSPLYKSIPPNSPLNRNVPTGDADPPPTLPFGPQSITPSDPIREANQPVTLPNPVPTANLPQAPSNDPPPTPPASLASLAN
jgi:hypothetical protein